MQGWRFSKVYEHKRSHYDGTFFGLYNTRLQVASQIHVGPLFNRKSAVTSIVLPIAVEIAEKGKECCGAYDSTHNPCSSFALLAWSQCLFRDHFC